MSYSVAKVSKAYQAIRAICRQSAVESFYEARIRLDTESEIKWNLTAKEDKSLKRMCGWLGM